MQRLTRHLAERAPTEWLKVRCEVRVASPYTPTPLEIVIGDGDRPDERRTSMDPAIHESAMGLVRKLTSSVSTFPGIVIQMTRLDEGRWHINATLMNGR
jgi:hypothetical protein